MMQKKNFFLAVLLSGLLIAGCNKDDGNNTVSFDRKAMLENYANNLIIPTYQNLKSKTDSLKAASDAFVANSGTVELNAFRSIFLNTYRAWQAAEVYELGPAKDVQ